MTSRSTLLKRIEAVEARQASGQIDRDRLRETVRLMRATIPRTADAEGEARKAAEELGPRWAAQSFHEVQSAAFYSEARRRAIEAGRRSGKSEGRKREIVIDALDPDWIGYSAPYNLTNRIIVVGGPTQEQTENLYWSDLLAMIPKWAIREVRKSKHQIETITGAIIYVLGMDRPQRAEGFPTDELFFDEFADTKPEVWTEHLQPGSQTPGRPPSRVTFFSTPDMKSGEHFIDLADRYRDSDDPNEQHFRWTSIGIIPDETLAEWRRSMSRTEWTVQILAERATTGDRAYHAFDAAKHTARGIGIVEHRPLWWTFDFNTVPGVAVIAQRQTFDDYTDDGSRPDWAPECLQPSFLAVLDEVYIPAESNTRVVTNELVRRYGTHKGHIELYGDPAGGARGTAKLDGSDWDIIERIAKKQFPERGAVVNRVARAAPAQRARLNVADWMFCGVDGESRVIVDKRCRYLIRDFERVAIKPGTTEIHKPTSGPGADLTHLADSITYGMHAVFADERSKRLAFGKF